MNKEEKAIDQLKKGDPNGLRFLVEKYQVKAVRVAFLISQDRELAEDAVQTAFEKLLRKKIIEKYDSKRIFWPWFETVVRNDTINECKRRYREDFVGQYNPIDDSHPDPASLLAKAETKEEILKLIQERLSPAQRDAIYMFYFEGLSIAEISANKGNKIGTIKRNLFDGRGRLFEILRRRKTN